MMISCRDILKLFVISFRWLRGTGLAFFQDEDYDSAFFTYVSFP